MKKTIILTEEQLIRVIEKLVKENVENINPKNLKYGDREPKNLKNGPIHQLQKKLMDLGYLKIKQPTGFFGNLTKSALERYQTSKSNKTISKDSGTTNKKVDIKSGYILLFAFPDYQPAAGDSWLMRNIVAPATQAIYGGASGGSSADHSSSASGSGSGKTVKLGRLGHGGCVIITSDGNAKLFEFGRYESDDYGVVKKRDLGKIAKMENGVLTNSKQVATIAKSKTQGQGPKLKMNVNVIKLPNPPSAIQYADVKGPQEYTVADPMQGGAKNCGTYALEAAIAGGVDTTFKCFASPIGIVEHTKDVSTQSFVV